MFDLITGEIERPLRERAPGSKVTSVALHISLLTAVLVIPLLGVARNLPEVRTMMAFVAAADIPQLPPPPPPAPALPRAAQPAVPPIPQRPQALVAPLDMPTEFKAEAPTDSRALDAAFAGVAGGVEGGTEGGVVGGTLGGVVGSIVLAAAPPPPPPPPRPKGPVRIGGEIKSPALLRRIEPIYPPMAVSARLEGVVILEAMVRADGSVDAVSVLKSRTTLLDKAAIEAVKQWQYSPLILDGVAMPFVLTVTLTFSLG